MSYDGVGRLSAVDASGLGGYGYSMGLTCNAADQIVTRTRSNDSYAFGGYMNVSRGYQKNGLNQYTQAGNLTLSYDANGNLTSDSISGYGYDVENRLISGPGPGTVLTWDALGRLWEVAGTSGTTRFVYDGDRLAGEYNAAGTLLRRYAHGTGADDPLIWYEGSGLSDRRALHADHQGSIVAVSSGTGVTPYAYDEYGIPGANQTGRFQYTGQAWIPELGMYHYKARFYSPTLGRFLQTDPVGYDDQINLYAYVANDPVNRTDPTGEWGNLVVGAIIGAGLEVGIQTIVEGKSIRDIDLGDVAIAAVAGAAGQGLLKNAGRLLAADLKAVKAENAAARAAARAERTSAAGTRRQAREAAFHAGKKAEAAKAAGADAAKTAVKAAAGVAVVAGAKKLSPPVTEDDVKKKVRE